MTYLTLEEIIVIHNLLVERHGGSLGIRDIRLLESAIMRPQTSFGGIELYPDAYSKAAVLSQGLIKNHAFLDGNKRVGIHAALTFLRLNGIKAKYGHKALIKLAVDIANNKKTVEDIGEFYKNENSE